MGISIGYCLFSTENHHETNDLIYSVNCPGVLGKLVVGLFLLPKWLKFPINQISANYRRRFRFRRLFGYYVAFAFFALSLTSDLIHRQLRALKHMIDDLSVCVLRNYRHTSLNIWMKSVTCFNSETEYGKQEFLEQL